VRANAAVQRRAEGASARTACWASSTRKSSATTKLSPAINTFRGCLGVCSGSVLKDIPSFVRRLQMGSPSGAGSDPQYAP